MKLDVTTLIASPENFKRLHAEIKELSRTLRDKLLETHMVLRLNRKGIDVTLLKLKEEIELAQALVDSATKVLRDSDE